MTETSRIDSIPFGKPIRELCPRPDPELCIGTGQVHLDGVDGQREGGGDLLVGHSAGGQLDDLALGRGQLAGGARLAAAYAREVGARLLGPAVEPSASNPATAP